MPWDSVDGLEIYTETGSINMTNVTWQNTKVKLSEAGAVENTLDNGNYSVYMYKKPWVTKYVDGEPTDEWEQYDGYIPAQGYFTVNYPNAGLFKIELKPAVKDPQGEYFDASKYEIWIYEYPAEGEETGSFRPIKADGETISQKTVYFQVRATSNVTAPHPEYRAQIDILFKPAGEGSEWISAYSEIRANYACVIHAETE